MKPYAQNVLAQKLDVAVTVAKHLINHISYSLENGNRGSKFAELPISYRMFKVAPRDEILV